MPSALEEFLASLEIAQALLNLEAAHPDPPPPEVESIVKGLRGGATVLMVAAFEEYLTAMFQEHLDRLDGVPPPVGLSGLPDIVQVTSMFTSLNRALAGPRYTDTEKKARLQDIRAAAQRLADDRVDPRSMSEAANNPDAKSVTALFKGMGRSTIFADVTPKYETKVAPVAKTYIRDRLNGIVQIRHVVAHTGAKEALNISRKDLADWMAFLGVLAELLNDELDSLVAGLLAPPGAGRASP